MAMQLEFYSPAGATEITARHAPRLPSLAHKRFATALSMR